MHDIETERLILHPLAERDEALFCRIYGDAELMRYVGKPLVAEVAARSFRRTLAQACESMPGRMFHVISLRDGGADVGLVGLVRETEQCDTAAMGAMVLTEWQRCGFAFETLSALLGEAFGELGLNCVKCDHHPANKGSARLMARLGFERRPADSGRVDWLLDRDRWRARQRHENPRKPA